MVGHIDHIRARSDVATNVPSVKGGEYQTDPSTSAINLLRSEKSVCSSAVKSVFSVSTRRSKNFCVSTYWFQSKRFTLPTQMFYSLLTNQRIMNTVKTRNTKL